ncbi:MAG: metalloregulator ArsR/SmtB family transcription factor [Desulfurivibrionaceae bacterium]|nr:metalloregulator ArsR/SmtB family transcription factor [Desulfobulbales bacterium]MDT8335135.1 metalloregulator ArsR/SmtB family transcription factor [Desulfurivibrionaceae bacterium]
MDREVMMDKNREDACLCRIIHSERVEKARRTALQAPEYDRLANLFKAMGDPTRLQILLALSQEEMCVCDLAAFLNITESAVSHQLRMLRQLYLVANRRDGPVLYYRLDDGHITRLLDIGLEHLRE